MKLRTQGNSIRLRLNKTDVEKFASDGTVAEVVEFDNGSGSVFEYRLEKSAVRNLSAKFEEGRLTVLVPAAAAQSWTGTDQVGIESDDGKLRLLVEKDFVCLTPRNDVDESDNYPHPDEK